MPLDQAQWQIILTAADQTSAAFSSLEKKIKEAEKQMEGLGKTASKSMGPGLGAELSKLIGSQFSNLTKYATRFASALAPAAVAYHAFMQSIEGTEIQKQADALGLSYEAFQAYRMIALQSSIASKTFEESVTGLGGVMAAANVGDAEAIGNFEKLGVKILDVNGKLRPLGDVLPEVARGLLNVANESERAAIAKSVLKDSSGRVLAILPQLAEETDKVTEAARAQGQILSKDASKAWESFKANIEHSITRYNTFAGNLAAPIVTTGLDAINEKLVQAAKNAEKANTALLSGKLFGSGGVLEAFFGKDGTTTMGGLSLPTDAERQLMKLEAGQRRLAELEKDRANASGVALNTINDQIKKQRELVATQEAAYKVAAKTAENEKDLQRLTGDGLPAKSYAVNTGGSSNPTVPSRGGAMGSNGEDSAERRLSVLLAERQALERAMQAFKTAFSNRETETVEQVEKRLQRAVELDKQIANLTKNVPKESEVAKQLTEEATRLSELNTQWEAYKRVVAGAEQTITRYGDGSRELKRTLKELDEQLRQQKISQEEHAWAVKDATDKYDQQNQAARGAAGGIGAFGAGIESVLKPASQMSREFLYGQKAMQLLDDAIAQMVNNGEVNFQRLLASFATMLIQMEMKAAASSIFKAVGGFDLGGSLLSGLVGGLVNVAGGFSFDGMASGSMLSGLTAQANTNVALGKPGMAIGGPVTENRPYLVGERGPEMFVPDAPGRIATNDVTEKALNLDKLLAPPRNADTSQGSDAITGMLGKMLAQSKPADGSSGSDAITGMLGKMLMQSKPADGSSGSDAITGMLGKMLAQSKKPDISTGSEAVASTLNRLLSQPLVADVSAGNEAVTGMLGKILAQSKPADGSSGSDAITGMLSKMLAQSKKPDISTGSEAVASTLNRLLSQPLVADVSAGNEAVTGMLGKILAHARATGGPVTENKPYLVGERGPELFVPDSPGRIAANGTPEDAGSVTIQMTNSFGGGVTHAEMLRYGAMIEERAKAGAMAGIEAKRKRGGSIKQVFRG